MSDLAGMKCVPCRAGSPPVTDAEIAGWMPRLPGWQIVTRGDIPRLERVFRFSDFAQALDFTVRIGRMAEEEDHHPALLTEWGKVTVTWWTHAINGLHRNDFIMAARTGQAYENK